jgi:DNA-binding NarL/FixJ family response regulator
MKVLLVDDHPLILSALQTIINTLDDAVAVVTADNPADAFALLARDPEVELVLLDLGLGQDVDGFAVLADLRARYPALPVVVVSATERLADMVRAVDMGAMGFVPKRTPNRELFEALALVLSGGVFIPPALLGLVRLPGVNLIDLAVEADAAAALRAANAAVVPGAWSPTPLPGSDAASAVMRPMPGDAPPALALAVGATGVLPRAAMVALGLTPRQGDVLTLLLKGLPNKLIARELNVSVDTVKDHVAAVLRALGVNSRTQAVLTVSRMTQQAGGGLVAAPRT